MLDQERLTAAIDRRTRVDGRLAENLIEIGRQLPRHVGRLPELALLDWAHAHRQALHALQEEPTRGDLRRDLQSAAASMATFEGWLLIPLGQPRLATDSLWLAARLAHEAGDADALALALTYASQLYSSVRPEGAELNPALARALLEAAERLATRESTVRARALLRLAEERLVSGDEAAAERLVDEADRVAGASRRTADGVYQLWDPAFCLAGRGNVARLAGRPRQGIPLLEGALTALRPGSVANRSRITVDLCLAVARHGDVDHACDLLGQALTLSDEAKMNGLRPHILRARDQGFARYAREPVVKRLDERLRAMA